MKIFFQKNRKCCSLASFCNWACPNRFRMKRVLSIWILQQNYKFWLQNQIIALIFLHNQVWVRPVGPERLLLVSQCGVKLVGLAIFKWTVLASYETDLDKPNCKMKLKNSIYYYFWKNIFNFDFANFSIPNIWSQGKYLIRIWRDQIFFAFFATFQN